MSLDEESIRELLESEEEEGYLPLDEMENENNNQEFPDETQRNEILETFFSHTQNPNVLQKIKLANQLGVSHQFVQEWLKERRKCIQENVSEKSSEYKRFSANQNEILYGFWATKQYPIRNEVKLLANKTGLESRQIKTWFLHRRQILRKKLNVSVKRSDKKLLSAHLRRENFILEDEPIRLAQKTFSPKQMDKLIKYFESNQNPKPIQVKSIASDIKADFTVVQRWFKNRVNKIKREELKGKKSEQNVVLTPVKEDCNLINKPVVLMKRLEMGIKKEVQDYDEENAYPGESSQKEKRIWPIKRKWLAVKRLKFGSGGKRRKFSDLQRNHMIRVFEVKQNPDYEEILAISKDIGLSTTQIETWFRYRRFKLKRNGQTVKTLKPANELPRKVLPPLEITRPPPLPLPNRILNFSLLIDEYLRSDWVTRAMLDNETQRLQNILATAFSGDFEEDDEIELRLGIMNELLDYCRDDKRLSEIIIEFHKNDWFKIWCNGIRYFEKNDSNGWVLKGQEFEQFKDFDGGKVLHWAIPRILIE